jgi:hypothetical protein
MLSTHSDILSTIPTSTEKVDNFTSESLDNFSPE